MLRPPSGLLDCPSWARSLAHLLGLRVSLLVVAPNVVRPCCATEFASPRGTFSVVGVAHLAVVPRFMDDRVLYAQGWEGALGDARCCTLGQQ